MEKQKTLYEEIGQKSFENRKEMSDLIKNQLKEELLTISEIPNQTERLEALNTISDVFRKIY